MLGKQGSGRVYKRRRMGTVVLLALILVGYVAGDYVFSEPVLVPQDEQQLIDELHQTDPDRLVRATYALGQLAVRERVDRTGYARSQFGNGWAREDGCDMRNRILLRDLDEAAVGDDGCTVMKGVLKNDPYTGADIPFQRGPETSGDIHIEHIVALSDAWQKGAQRLTPERRVAFANDPLNLIAVEGVANMVKGDADAAEWLPSNEPYRCRYIARQIAIKLKYELWVTQREHGAMKRVLQSCPEQLLPIEREQAVP